MSKPMCGARKLPAIALVVAVGAASASAEPEGEAGRETRPDKSRYTLFNPTPRDLMREMSTDRPDTTESPYTVDAGHIQIEMSVVDFGYDYANDASETRRAFAVAPMLLKVGLLNNVDLQIGIDPYTWEKTTDRTTNVSGTAQGFGDTVARLKVNLWGNDGGETALAIMPFVKFPTADSDLGNGDVEGGIIVPLAIALPDEFSLGLMAEFDFNRSAADDRHVVDFVHTITIGRGLIGELGGYIEFAGFANLNGDERYRGYFDAGLTYGLTADIQLDTGIRAGLTESADDFGLFVGISMRF
ncbi:MAG: transporter [Phycisphaerales bacterium]